MLKYKKYRHWHTLVLFNKYVIRCGFGVLE